MKSFVALDITIYRPSYGGSWRAGAGGAIVHSFPDNIDSSFSASIGSRVVRFWG